MAQSEIFKDAVLAVIGTRPVRDVARDAKVHYSTIYEMKKGHIPRPDILTRVADNLGLKGRLREILFASAGIVDPQEVSAYDYPNDSDAVRRATEEAAENVLAASGARFDAEFGEKLQEITGGLTAEQLSERVPQSPSFVAAVLRGWVPPKNTLIDWATRLDLPYARTSDLLLWAGYGPWNPGQHFTDRVIHALSAVYGVAPEVFVRFERSAKWLTPRKVDEWVQHIEDEAVSSFARIQPEYGGHWIVHAPAEPDEKPSVEWSRPAPRSSGDEVVDLFIQALRNAPPTASLDPTRWAGTELGKILDGIREIAARYGLNAFPRVDDLAPWQANPPSPSDVHQFLEAAEQRIRRIGEDAKHKPMGLWMISFAPTEIPELGKVEVSFMPNRPSKLIFADEAERSTQEDAIRYLLSELAALSRERGSIPFDFQRIPPDLTREEADQILAAVREPKAPVAPEFPLGHRAYDFSDLEDDT